MRIIFIRHGQTDYNQRKLFYGVTDVPINQAGRKQSSQVANKVKAYSVDNIYTSQMRRTIETANIIFPQKRMQSKAYLNEWGFGLWEGLNANQIQAAFPNEWQAWLEQPFDYTPPGATPFKSCKQAMIAGFQALLAKQTAAKGRGTKEKDLAIVSHLGTIRVLLHELFPEIAFWDIALNQGNITVIDNQQGIWQKEKWNE